MIPIFRSRDPAFEEAFLKRLRRNPFALVGEPLVLQILEDVRRRGDIALLYWTEKLDKVTLPSEELLYIPREEDLNLIEDELKEALFISAENIRRFCTRSLPSSFTEEREGFLVGTLYRPLERVGIYVPGGKALYPSTLLMSAIPARVAGVKEIIMVTPPRPQGLPDVLKATAWIAGVDRIYTVGGVQAIAALAFGTETIPPVDKIVGPGNQYVAEAKRLLYGFVGIDLIAGPTELCILADRSAPPLWIAADLIAQAEHDETASPLCFTLAEEHLESVPRALEELLKDHPRRAVAEKSLRTQGLLVLCEDSDSALEWINKFAPEHLELLVENPEKLLPFIRNAGAVFLGTLTPEAMGDYIAGPNHILPTQGSARFLSPLGVEDFLKRISIIEMREEGIRTLGPKVIRLARAEELPGHGESVRIRLE